MKENSNQEKKNIFVEMENEVLAFWKKNEIFEKSVQKDAPKGEYVFYDGPPFATGTPHYGHLVASLMKDVVPRFWTMNGYQVQRKWGWDCHGLPIENIVEKELGTKSKKEIEEKIGVAKFNALCRERAAEFTEEWKKTIRRMGRWVDMENPYRTMDLPYMESVWWAFKQLWDNDLIYQDYRSMYICPRCETTLSQSEVAEGYRDVKDLSVTIKFELVDEPGTYILAWTTTPWTLPGNVALAVGNDILYCEVRIKNEDLRFVLAKERVNDVLKNQEFEITRELRGKDLVGKKYRPLFDYYARDEKLANRENGWKIYRGDFVTIEDGTGVVHIAPAFGEDDMNLGRAYKLPFVQHVAMNGTFNKEMGEFSGLHVKPIEDVQATDVKIIKYLAEKNLLFAKEKYEHSYPFCWRCDTPLINYATSSWFVKIADIKTRMLELAEAINWSPEHIKAGRFGKWLEGARDWSISRQRFWASCLPIWQCACGAKKVIGSLEEFYRQANGQLTKLILVRHGEAENNLANIISTGLNKYHLTEKGRAQAKEAAEKVKTEIGGREEQTIIYSSPILRAKESAEIIAHELKLQFKIAEEVGEIAFGSWEDQNEDLLSANDELHRQFDSLPAEGRYGFKRGGSGENGIEVGQRVYAWLEKILKANEGKIIVVITHGDPVIDLINELKSRNDREAAAAWNGPEYPEKGSVKIVYLNNATGKEIDLHKDSVDNIALKCDVCPGEMKRVSDVLDCWFESGSMPYAQMHYPFENKERFKRNFPAEFIAEGVDQTRAWFYYLHALAVGIENNYAYKNVIVNGIVLAEDGKKMAKRLKNYPDPEVILEKYGADALRYYLLTSPVMQAENLNFSEKGVADCLRKPNMILWNVYKFYEMYAVAGAGDSGDFEFKNILDKWIIARLNQLVSEVSLGMEHYDLPRAARPITQFIDDFSTWYLRRSRDRFKDEGEDKKSALETTRLVLTDLAKVMAPFTPFIAEQLWQKVTGNNFLNSDASVHLEDWPSASFRPRFHEDKLQRESSNLEIFVSDEVRIDESILIEMALARKIVELGLAKRDEAGIKVRQPLAELRITNYELRNEYAELIKDELNVKNIISTAGTGDLAVELDTALTPELITEGAKRELVRFINAERKNAGLTIGDKIILHYETAGARLQEAMEKYGPELQKDVLAEEISPEGAAGGKEVEVNGEKIILKIEKI